MWAHSRNGDAGDGAAGRRCRGWSHRHIDSGVRKREATTNGGQGQRERGRRTARETSILTDRLLEPDSSPSSATYQPGELGNVCQCLLASVSPAVKWGLGSKPTCLLYSVLWLELGPCKPQTSLLCHWLPVRLCQWGALERDPKAGGRDLPLPICFL